MKILSAILEKNGKHQKFKAFKKDLTEARFGQVCLVEIRTSSEA